MDKHIIINAITITEGRVIGKLGVGHDVCFAIYTTRLITTRLIGIDPADQDPADRNDTLQI